MCAVASQGQIVPFVSALNYSPFRKCTCGACVLVHSNVHGGGGGRGGSPRLETFLPALAGCSVGVAGFAGFLLPTTLVQIHSSGQAAAGPEAPEPTTAAPQTCTQKRFAASHNFTNHFFLPNMKTVFVKTKPTLLLFFGLFILRKEPE